MRLVALVFVVMIALAGCALVPGAAAADDPIPCAWGSGYPGDAAAKDDIAAWMASGAIAAGLPGELPVMGALVESGLTNLPPGDADSVGYFQMRVGIWNQGEYARFPDHPELQLKWFVDQAIYFADLRAAAGIDYRGNSNLWGEWAADVLQPAAQYRGRYQLRLADARALIVAGCVPGGPIPPALAPVDTIAPLVGVTGRRIQDAIRRRAIVVEASCPAEACVARARGLLSLPGAARVHRIKSSPRQIGKGDKAKLTLRIARGFGARSDAL
jgi:hypothetical protein